MIFLSRGHIFEAISIVALSVDSHIVSTGAHLLIFMNFPLEVQHLLPFRIFLFIFSLVYQYFITCLYLLVCYIGGTDCMQAFFAFGWDTLLVFCRTGNSSERSLVLIFVVDGTKVYFVLMIFILFLVVFMF